MKKNKKRSNRNMKSAKAAYTPGRNMFGEKAETYLIVLERETAVRQIFDAIKQLNGTVAKEFTFDWSCFNGHEEEYTEVTAKVESILEMKARMMNHQFGRYGIA